MGSTSLKLPKGFSLVQDEKEGMKLPSGFSLIDQNLGENVQARVSSGNEEISNTAEPGYWEQVGSRLKQQFFPTNPDGSPKTVSLPEAMGLDAILRQYGTDALKQDFDDIKSGKKTVSEVIVDKIPFFGPSLNEATKAAANDKPKTAAAILTTDVLAPGLINKAMGKVGDLAPTLEKSAAKNYTSVLEPTAKRNVPVAENLAGKLAEEKIVARSRESLQNQAKAGMREYGPKAATAFDNAAPVDFSKAFDALEDVKQRHVYIKGTNTVPAHRVPLEKMISSIQDDLFNLADQHGNIPASVLDSFVDDINKGLVGANGEFRTQVPPKSIAQIQKSSARAIRTILDSPNPDAASINSAYSMYAKLNEFLEDSRRKRITAQSGITTGSSKGFGALVERTIPRPIRNLPKDIAGVFDSVPWNTVSGAIKQTLAEAVAQSNWKKVRLFISGPLSVAVANGAQRSQQQNSQLQPALETQ